MNKISTIIKEYCRTNRVSVYTLASLLNLRPSSLYRSLNSRFLTVERLQLISQALNHNFFIYFVQQSGSSEEQLLKLTTENKELTTKVVSLQKEVTYLQEINALLKAKL